MKWLSVGILFAANSVCAQISRPAFDVASIKPNTRCDNVDGRSGGRTTPGRMALVCADLRDLILTAYGIYGNGANPASGSFRMQVVGGPAWMDSERFDIVAQPAGNLPRSEMFGPMLQSLLEDRFKLKVHPETREGRVYLLTIAKNGPRLDPTKDGTCIIADVNHPPEARQTPTRVCGNPSIGPDGTFNIYGATMSNLCSQLGIAMDREVIDKTGLSGRFDIHLQASPADLNPKFLAGRSVDQTDQAATDDSAAGPSIFTALQQQLGLKLESAKGPMRVIVVDHIEQPSEN